MRRADAIERGCRMVKRVGEFLFASVSSFARSMARRGTCGTGGKDEKKMTMGSGLARGCRSSAPWTE